VLANERERGRGREKEEGMESKQEGLGRLGGFVPGGSFDKVGENLGSLYDEPQTI